VDKVDAFQDSVVLCCRKKKRADKWRFSFDPHQMEKRRGKNPKYCAKMRAKDKEWKVCMGLLIVKFARVVCSLPEYPFCEIESKPDLCKNVES